MGVNGIYGLSGSGLDIESMVKVGMMGKQNEYDKMAQKYTKNEWTKAAYLEISDSISTFNMTKLSDYKYSSSMNARTADSTSSAVKVSANATAAIMSHRVQVTSLASNAYLIGEQNSIKPKNTAATTEAEKLKLSNVIFKDFMTEIDDDTVSVTYGKDNTFTKQFSKDEVALSFTLKNGTGDDAKSEKIEVKYGELYDGFSLNSLASRINNKNLNIKASYDAVNNSFSFYNSKGGESNQIIFELDTVTASGYGSASHEEIATLNARDFLNNLNLKQSKDESLIAISEFTAGQSVAIKGTSGIIKVDGATYDTDDNKVTVGGITYTAVDTTKDTTAVVTVSQDVDAIVDKVKSFVEDYNKLLSSLYEKYDEKSDSNYKPLTQSQKDGMKEEQITKWEEKAKQGILYHDRTLQKIILDMRSAISTSIDLGSDEQISAYNIGISTTGLKGQLRLDEDKLRSALAQDSDAVYNVFAKLDANNMDEKSTSGIAQRLGDVFTTAIKNIKSRAGSSSDVTEDSDLNNLLRNLQTKMSNFKKMMNAFEDALYKKYDKMESALAKLGTQMNYIMGSSSS